MLASEVIADARILIHDDSVTLPKRFTDADMLNLLNQLMKRVVGIRPDLFITTGAITPTANQVEQTLPSGAVRIMEIHRVVSGEAVQEVDKDVMDRGYSNWTTATAGTPINWMRHPRNPVRYFLYPAPTSDITLQAEYINSPAELTLGATVPLADAYRAALVDGLVFLTESIDTETVGSGRAEFYMQSFMEGFGVDFTQRATVDNEDGNVGASVQRQQRRSSDRDR